MQWVTKSDNETNGDGPVGSSLWAGSTGADGGTRALQLAAEDARG